MATKILKRKVYDKMINWKKEHAPDYALFLKGARRTGKTTLAEQLGKNEYKSFITINFQSASKEVKDLFINNLMDLDDLFTKLELIYKTKLYNRNSLIILDEIQLFPEGRQALKTLLEDKRFDYIETGSLATITYKSRSKNILIPSEEEDIEVYPLDFEEFLWALKDNNTIPIIKNNYNKLKPFGKVLLKSIMNDFRTYMCVGGMPQAVIKYIETKDLSKVDFVKTKIVDLYKKDIKEQEYANEEYVGNLFENIPSQLSKHDKRYILTQINKSARLNDYRTSIGWLEDSMIVNIARSVNEVSPALSLSLDDKRYKMYLGDTGLLINLAFKNGSYLNNEYYKAILLDKLHVNEGMFIENLVAQCLKSNGHIIRYNIKSDPISKRITREVDFLINDGLKVNAIEVKTSDKFSIKSLIDIKKCFNNKIGKQIVLYNGDIKREDNIIYLPYFMAAII